MPTRKYNFTGRRRLRQGDITVQLNDDVKPLTFGVTKLALGSYGFPEHASVCVEVYRQMSYERIDCGTVSQLELPDNVPLTEFREPDALRYRIKVISKGAKNGQLLGEFSARFDQGQDSLLPVEPDDSLGQEVYRVNFDSDEPVLLINSSKLTDWKGVATDPVFVALVYPSVLREILERAVRDHFPDEDSDDWQSRWVRFATNFLRVSKPAENPDRDVLDEWIEEIVEVFSMRQKLYDDFSTYWNRDGA